MRARHSGTCPICAAGWMAGDQIKRLTGDWVHEGCKWPTAIQVVEGEPSEPPLAWTRRQKTHIHIKGSSIERTGDKHGLRPPSRA